MFVELDGRNLHFSASSPMLLDGFSSSSSTARCIIVRCVEAQAIFVFDVAIILVSFCTHIAPKLPCSVAKRSWNTILESRTLVFRVALLHM